MPTNQDHGDLVTGDWERDLGTHGRGASATLRAAPTAVGVTQIHLAAGLRRIETAMEPKPDDHNEPHESDCAHWADEPCDRLLGRRERSA